MRKDLSPIRSERVGWSSGRQFIVGGFGFPTANSVGLLVDIRVLANLFLSSSVRFGSKSARGTSSCVK